jgi:Na+/melibiose symporter-like transporter
MLSDVTDLEERSSGRRLSGMVFSTNLFAIKLGIAIGGATIGWFLAYSGYIGGAASQSAEATHAINMLYTVVPSIFVLSIVAMMQFYSLNDAKVAQLRIKDTSIVDAEIPKKVLLKIN